MAVALGGAAGSVARYCVQQSELLSGSRTWPTIAVNIAGCFLIGVAAVMFGRRGTAEMRLLCVTGFLGGFTTYSTFMLDAATLLRAGEYRTAALYVGVSLVGGLMAFAAGWAATEKLTGLT